MLDYYTLEDFKIASEDLASKTNPSDSVYYKEFNMYMGSESVEGQIWYSNSNGRQMPNNLDATKCNQDYKCGFTAEAQTDAAINMFVFLRPIGICHDTKADGTKAGLTFQAIHALPIGYFINEDHYEETKY